MKNFSTKALVLPTLLFAGILVGFAMAKASAKQVVLIPRNWQSSTVSAEEVAAQEIGKLNINTANVSELVLLPGIGEEIANRIVQYRDENGLFIRTTDIMKVQGIGKTKFKSIEKYITVAVGGRK